MLSQSNKTYIFLSHHSSKLELTAHLSEYLKRNGLESWYAPACIRAGEQWDEAINKAIKHCMAVVLLFCAQADSSIQIKRELALADKYKKPVFWVRVERVEPVNLSYYLTSTQWFDWLDIRDVTLEQLVDDIKSLSIHVVRQTAMDLRMTNYKHKARNDSWVKGVIAARNEREAAECAARVYFGLAENHPDSSVILPTGRSATMLFRMMLKIAEEYDSCPFGEAQILSDTETFGVWSGHETSRTRHINEMLIEPLRHLGKAPKDSQLHLLSGIYSEKDPVRDAQRVLRLFPPIVHGVSVSPLGEILAYEVGTYNNAEDIINDTPRIVEVGEHSKNYIDPDQPSKSILTVGLGTALSSDVLLVLAFDMRKSNIVNRLFNGPMTPGIPATLLRNHPNAYLVTTERVAKEAKIEDYSLEDMAPKESACWIIKE